MRKQIIVNPRRIGLSDALASLSLRDPPVRIRGDTQMMRVARAVQNPYAESIPGKARSNATDLLLADQNPGVCPVGEGDHGDRVVKKTIVGRGKNALVWLLEKPTSSSELGLGVETGLVLKENLEPIFVYDPRGEIQGSDLDEQVAISTVPCWDPEVRQYRCRIEAEPEVLISSLASKLFTDGVTPGTVIQLESFTCSDPGNEGKLFMIQELLGAESDGYLVNSLDRLPELLHAQNTRKGGSAVIIPHRFSASRSDEPTLVTPFGKILLKRASLEVTVSVLHTIAVLQQSFGIVTLDTKLSNILFKEFDGRAYFRNRVMRPKEVEYIRYDFRAPGERRTRSFWIPNAGWIPKVADMGMAVAFKVPYREGDFSSEIDYTTIGFHAYLPDRFPEIQKRYKLGAAVLDNPNIGRGALTELAESLGYSRSRAVELAEEAKKTFMGNDIVEYAAIMRNRNDFGIHEEFSTGYDPHMFVASLARSLETWLGGPLDDPDDYSPILLLQRVLGYTFPEETGIARPRYEAVSEYGPLDALTLLHQYGEYAPGNEEPVAARSLYRTLKPYVIAPNVDTSKILVVGIPETPVI